MRTTTTTEATAAGMLRLAEQRLVKHHPFHAQMVSTWRTEACPSVGTVGITVRDFEVFLIFNPAFVTSCSLPELVGVLHHEVNHLLFEHPWADHRLYPDTKARLIAEEVTVNEWVPEPLPGRPITLAQYPELPPDEDTDTRYRRLERRETSKGKTSGSQEQKNGNTEPKTSASVQPLDDHSLWAEVRKTGIAGRWVVRTAMRQAWKELDQLQRQSLPDRLRERVQAVTRDHGDWPGDRVQVLDDGWIARIDWRKALRRYMRQATMLQPCYLRPPRRFPRLVGLIPGHVHRPQKAKVTAVVDTSGSIDECMLQAIAAELGQLGRVHDVTVVECDTKVQALYPFAGHFRQARGRGGTDLRPPFAADVLRKVRPDVIVYFTDGLGPAPKRPPSVGVLWCLTPSGRRPASWGRAIRMLDHVEKGGTA